MADRPFPKSRGVSKGIMAEQRDSHCRASRSFGSYLFLVLLSVQMSPAQVQTQDTIWYLDPSKSEPGIHLFHGARKMEGSFGAALEFTTALQYAEVASFPKLLGIEAMTVGGWFYPRRTGEQYFIFRGTPEIAPNGERMFPPARDWVNFVLGTDQRGFLLGTINGNGSMPFPHVTVQEVPFDGWNQLVVVKDKEGVHRFYHNGQLVHSDEHSSSREKRTPWRDHGSGEPLRLAMTQGGLIGEAWVCAKALSAEEIRQDFQVKRLRYHAAIPVAPVLLREMNSHPRAGLWPVPISAESWAAQRERVKSSALSVLGEFPIEQLPLDPQVLEEVDCGLYVRRKISLQVQPNDRMPAYLLVPKGLKAKAPAVICFYGTTSGAGKDTTVGLSGRSPGSPPVRSYSFAIDMVEAGFVALAADYLRDGERVKPGRRPYDTTDFYAKHPQWSIHGKDMWDTSRAIDYLQTLDFVDPDRIGMTGHSYGGHSTIFTAALEPRIRAAVANGPVSDFLHHGLHWAVPKGAGNSQSMPALRPYLLDRTMSLPVTFYEFTALIAPRPLLVGQAAGERRPMEEENYAAVQEVYAALGYPERVRYHWYAGDHDYPPEARRAAVDWFRKWLRN